MVAEMHPHAIELVEYVEDELPQARREEIAAHLATCGVCAEQVELAAAGREALRGTELLELPEDRRDALIMRFALDMDNREIARALGRTDGATKVLIHRAIKQLEEELGND